MHHFRHLVEATGCDIVVSSSWQSNDAANALLSRALERWGLPVPIGRTCVKRATGLGAARRAAEVANWARAHPAETAGGWVALDDLDLTTETGQPSLRSHSCSPTQTSG